MISQKYFHVFLKKLPCKHFIKHVLILCMFFLNVANASEKGKLIELQIFEHPPIIGTTLYIRQIMCQNLLSHNDLQKHMLLKKEALDAQLFQLVNSEKTYLAAQHNRRTQFNNWLNTSFFDPLNENNERIGRNHIIGVSFFKTFFDRALNTCLLSMIVRHSWQVKKEVDYLDRAFDNFKCLIPSHLKTQQKSFQQEFQIRLAEYLKEGTLYYKNYLLAFRAFQCSYNRYFYPSLFSQFQHYIQQKKDQIRSSLLGNISSGTDQDNQNEQEISSILLSPKL